MEECSINTKSCFFIVHRDTEETIYPKLRATVERHALECNVTEFIVGHYGNFDRLAAKAVMEVRKQYPQITLLLLIPYHPAERPMKTPEGYDGTFYPPDQERVPRKLAIVRANRYMIDHVDYLIAYAWHPGSNAKALIEYAEKQKHRIGIENLSKRNKIDTVDKNQ